MTKTNTKARFWKCALQVNPACYIQYRGKAHDIDENEYNNKLLKTCLEEEIKIVGLADHGNVSCVDAIRSIMNPHGIIVFPGFEISSTEKTHFVCLFPETTSTEQLSRYLGALQLTDTADGVRPSTLGGIDLLNKVKDLGGIAYAAHCTDDNGILKRKLNHVWTCESLKAAQIPGTLDDLKTDEGNGFRQILLNKNPDYKRENLIPIINAKDIVTPEDLRNPKATCLIKMTEPNFESFKLAFQDPESRVKLNSDISEFYYSQIKSMKVTGGYLDDISINFSEHLNSIIGGRGTGKSTLIECIRYALNLRPIGKNAQKQHDEIIRENIGKSKARIELIFRSSKMQGKLFTIARRYGESSTVTDENGNLSSFSPTDLMPEIEIYGQNEIYEIAHDVSGQRELLSRFLNVGQDKVESDIRSSLKKLAANREKLILEKNQISLMEDAVLKLPKLQEQASQFHKLGLDKKLEIIPQLEIEKKVLKFAYEDVAVKFNQIINDISNQFPDLGFLDTKHIEKLPHTREILALKQILEGLREDAETILSTWNQQYTNRLADLTSLISIIEAGIREEEENLEIIFKELPSLEGKSGREIGIEYQQLNKEIEEIRPKKGQIDKHILATNALIKERQGILSGLSKLRSERSAHFERSLKKINKKLRGKLKLTVNPESDRTPVIQFLLDSRLEGVADKRLAWIKEAEDFSPIKLAEKIRQGNETLKNVDWKITPTVADALTRLSFDKILELEEIELPDQISIELNTAHEGNDNYKTLDKLSTGQQCTAILHLLLLQNSDPLIMDQPEDNLDNAFIAERIVCELRSAKLDRQFIFATHNANIPVFGDAEWIGVVQSYDNQASLPSESQGAIDVPNIRDMAAKILEGGKIAFEQRRAKYGF